MRWCVVWRLWVTVRDYREAAELSEKLADKFVEILLVARQGLERVGLVAAVLLGELLVALTGGFQAA